MKTPKQRFLENPLSKTFLNTVIQPDFAAALDAALLQMIHEQPMQSTASGMTDTPGAAANAFRLDGAKRFIQILLLLPIDQPVKQPMPIRDNLEP